jgi:predicted nucleic-acid-binding protein
MIGLDSNVMLRAVLNDDVKWSQAARSFIQSQCTPEQPGYINPIVLAEICWVLRRRPEYNRERFAEFVKGMLEADNLVIADESLVKKALDDSRNGQAGFVDYLIAEMNAHANATLTYSIDGDATRDGIFEIIPQERL